jgi:hypothetical protein
MGRILYDRIGSTDKFFMPDELWKKIIKNCPDYRDLNNCELARNMVEVHTVGNTIYNVQYERYVVDRSKRYE